jgi:type I thyroxine 5'-deiodinase
VTSNREEHIEYAQPQTFIERQEVASACMIGLRLSIPALIDDMNNQADIAFNGWPERLYTLSPEGEIVYQGGKGPYGFDIDELDHFLEGYLPK